MIKYIAKRFLHLIPILLGITFLTLLLMHSVTADAIEMRYENGFGEVSTQEKEKQRAELGLDQPFLIQYANWLKNALHGDFGISYTTGKDVLQTFCSKLPNTVYLAAVSILMSIVISLLFGILSAQNQNKCLDYVIRFLCMIGNSLPGFFVSLLLLLIFSVKLKWFSVTGGQGIKDVVLPAMTLAIAMSAKYIRQIRTVILEEARKDYVTGARARGVREFVIYRRSILKSALSSIITLLALSIGSLLGGTAIIESIFMWDGVGKLALDSIMMRDDPMIQAYVIWMSFIYVAMNLIADIIYYKIDPRVRMEKEEIA